MRPGCVAAVQRGGRGHEAWVGGTFAGRGAAVQGGEGGSCHEAWVGGTALGVWQLCTEGRGAAVVAWVGAN